MEISTPLRKGRLDVRGNKIALLILIALIITAPVSANARVSDYQLDVTFVPERAYMKAVATVAFDTVSALPDTLVFYLHGELSVDSLFRNNRSVQFNQQSVYYDYDYSLIANRVAIPWSSGQPSRISIFYSGYFNPSKARSPSDYMRIEPGGVFLRAYGYSPWFPIFLESNADSYEVNFGDVTLRMPSEYVPIFAGDRLSEEVIAGERVSRWRADRIDLRAAQCTVGKFTVGAEENIYVYYNGDSASAAVAGAILEFVRKLNGEFGEKYRRNVHAGQMHIIEMPPYGDISSGNVTGISAGMWRDFESDEWSKRGLAHELVHPFVQTDTKQNDSLFALEIEGFPSYFHLPILSEFFGAGWYEKVMKQTEDEYLLKKKTGRGWRDIPLPREKPLARLTAEDISDYKDLFVLDDRALLFLNWLHNEMGQDRFFDFTRELFNSGPVTFALFKSAILKYLPAAQSDIDLWLYSTDFPERFYVKSK